MCYVKFVYSEAILINYPNSMKLEFLQGDARLHLKFIYNLLWWRNCHFSGSPLPLSLVSWQ